MTKPQPNTSNDFTPRTESTQARTKTLASARKPGQLTASGLVPIEIIREEMKRAVVINPQVPTVSEVLEARRRNRVR